MKKTRITLSGLALFSLMLMLIGCGGSPTGSPLTQGGSSAVAPTLPPEPLTAGVVATGEMSTALPPSEPTILAAQFLELTETAVSFGPTQAPPTILHTITPLVLPSPTNTPTPSAFGQAVLLVKSATLGMRNPPRVVDLVSPDGPFAQVSTAVAWPTEPGIAVYPRSCGSVATTTLTTAVTRGSVAGEYDVSLTVRWDYFYKAQASKMHTWHFHVDNNHSVVFTGEYGMEPPEC